MSQKPKSQKFGSKISQKILKVNRKLFVSQESPRSMSNSLIKRRSATNNIIHTQRTNFHQINLGGSYISRPGLFKSTPRGINSFRRQPTQSVPRTISMCPSSKTMTPFQDKSSKKSNGESLSMHEAMISAWKKTRIASPIQSFSFRRNQDVSLDKAGRGSSSDLRRSINRGQVEGSEFQVGSGKQSSRDIALSNSVAKVPSFLLNLRNKRNPKDNGSPEINLRQYSSSKVLFKNSHDKKPSKTSILSNRMGSSGLLSHKNFNFSFTKKSSISCKTIPPLTLFLFIVYYFIPYLK